MILQWDHTKDRLIFGEMDIILENLMLELPDVADRTSNERARNRIFPTPTKNSEEAEEWREYVHPGMEELFRSASDTVRADLAARDETEEGIIGVPRRHVDQWIHCLARARLIIAEENDFTEEELEDVPNHVKSNRDLERFRISFYGLIEQMLVREGWGGGWEGLPEELEDGGPQGTDGREL